MEDVWELMSGAWKNSAKEDSMPIEWDGARWSVGDIASSSLVKWWGAVGGAQEEASYQVSASACQGEGYFRNLQDWG